MSAKPISTGCYRVRGSGVDLYINASHPCDAICIVLALLGEV